MSGFEEAHRIAVETRTKRKPLLRELLSCSLRGDATNKFLVKPEVFLAHYELIICPVSSFYQTWRRPAPAGDMDSSTPQ